MTDPSKDSPEALHEAIDPCNAAWNAHDLDAIMALAPDMVFENQTAGESAKAKRRAPTSPRSSRPGPISHYRPGAST